MRELARLALAFPAIFLLCACGPMWNDPYPAQDSGKNILYSAFTERPKHLDPVQSYSEDEITFTAQIYEPPLQYHYLKRPYEVVPATAVAVPKAAYFGATGERLADDSDAARIGYTIYEIRIKPGILYAPHPALAQDANGNHLYLDLPADALRDVYALSDFKERGTRELTAEDYAYEIKRLAHPRLHSPIFGLMSEYIVGLKELSEALRHHNEGLPSERRNDWIDLRRFPLAGVEVVDRHTYRVKIKGKYPQFVYWLTMPFFAPMPWEADKFHGQPGMAERNLTLDWYPIGTGPYMLTENNPNARMVLTRNPNFRGETYPCEGEAADRDAGLLVDCGAALPFVDRAVFTREKEQIPYWNKFLQGYYDASGIASDSFDQAVQVAGSGEVTLTDDMRAQGIKLLTSVSTSTFYMGFNWLDPVVGGSDPATAERTRKLRQAIAIAIDQEEFISIFQNGRGIPAQSPLPPGICRSRLPGRARHEDRRAPGHQSRLDVRRGRGQVAHRLAGQAVPEDQRATGGAQYGLQPLPGEGAQGQHPAFLLGLERGLPGSRELPVPALRPAEQGEKPGRERLQLRQPGVRRPVRADEGDGEQPRAAGHHRPHAGHPAARRALGVGLPSQGLLAAPRLAHQPQADQGRQQYAQVSAHRRGAAGKAARRMEPPRTVAAGADSGVAGDLRAAGAARLSPARAGTGNESGAGGGRRSSRRPGGVIAYIVRRLFYAIPILLGVNLITFALFFVVNTPDDMARMQLGMKRVTPEAIQKWKEERGYDRPLLWNEQVQGVRKLTDTIFFAKSARMFVFDFGRADDGRDIAHEIKTRMGPSLAIALPVFVMGLFVTVSFALLLVLFRATYFDFWGVVACVAMMSISSLFYIIGGQYVVSKIWNLVPISGYAPGLDGAKFLLLPVVVSVIAGIGSSTRWYRTIFLEEIGKDYVRTARAKGLSEAIVLFRHVLRNAMIPILTGVVVVIPLLFMGSLITESFFGIPGLGSYTIDAINAQDFAVVRAMVFLGSLLYIIGLLLTDISYTLVDPRVRFE
ncbi:MAG: peptide transporter substrate-binding protein [Proteobacteria bacterium]|nr:peptide transporter substrate-binding protein [Pseudomonadota bacterium]